MTAKRAPDWSIRHAVRDPSFTPRASDVPALLDLFADDDAKLVKAATRVLGRIAPAALPLARTRLESAKPPVRGRLAALVGKLAHAAPDPVATLAPLLADLDPKTRRTASIALGKIRTAASERALLAYLADDRSKPHREVVAEALSKVGGEAARAALQAAEIPEIERSVLVLERSVGRATPSRIDVDARPAAPIPIVFHCRSGIERILETELGADWRARAAGPGRVDAVLSGRLSAAFRARTWMDLAFPLPRSGDSADAIVRALVAPEASRVFETFTRGPVRFRLAFESGRRRSIVWAVATGVARAKPSLVNDPTGSPWEVRVSDRGEVALSPRLEDPRFAYRGADVPAASHPSLAAALVRVAGLDRGAVVWDPFCGSGLELCERALAGPSRALYGSDRDPDAIEIARKNLAAAGVTDAVLEVADALDHEVPAPSLVITNPPYGSRSEFGRAQMLLRSFVDRVARVLSPGGRFVWISPIPEETAARAAAAGLEQTFRQPLDRDVEMQAYWKKVSGGGGAGGGAARARPGRRAGA